MAIHDRDYMKKPASPSEFPDSEQPGEAPKAKPFDLFAGLPVEEISAATISQREISTAKVERIDSPPVASRNHWMLAIILLLLGIVIGAVFIR